jgi:DUF1680 family protein
MPVQLMEAHPYVLEDRGSRAIVRGPLVYCIEAADHPGVDLAAVALPAGVSFAVDERPDQLGGIVALTATARETLLDTGWNGVLYRPAGTANPPSSREIALTAIPYHVWANRSPGQMRVWIPAE